jgi:ubiquinone/menaquinone biosynthesis C-methylase UbiE
MLFRGMELATAARLIETGIEKNKIQTWTDLGAGSGMFTNALSKLLPNGSTIIAVDQKPSKINVANGIHLRTIAGDFTKLDLEKVDGIVMANSLHYVQNQQAFIEKLATKTNRLILVEYNTDRGNQWVPYPISFNKLTSFVEATQIGSEPSQYHKEGIYSALILF